MSRKYKFRNPEGIYFISFATVYWIDVFIRNEYKDIIELYDNKIMEQKLDHLHNNPVEAGIVANAEDYPDCHW